MVSNLWVSALGAFKLLLEVSGLHLLTKHCQCSGEKKDRNYYDQEVVGYKGRSQNFLTGKVVLILEKVGNQSIRPGLPKTTVFQALEEKLLLNSCFPEVLGLENGGSLILVWYQPHVRASLWLAVWKGTGSYGKEKMDCAFFKGWVGQVDANYAFRLKSIN